MSEKLPGTFVTPQGLAYLQPKRKTSRRLPKNAAALSPTHIPKNRERAQMVAEEDTADGRRERKTIYEFGEPAVIDDLGAATGQPPVAVPLGGESAAEALDLMLENAERPRHREKRPDVRGDFERQMNERVFRGTGNRRVFGVPLRAWKGER